MSGVLAKCMRAKISFNYDMGGFKPILADDRGILAVFSDVHMKVKIFLHHQESVQCQVSLFLAAF